MSTTILLLLMIVNTAYCYLDQHYEKSDGKYNVKLCLYINRKRKYLKTKINLTLDEWNKLINPALKDSDLKSIRKSIKAIEAKANAVLDKLPNPTFDSFFDEYDDELNPQDKDPLISDWFDKYSKSLVKSGRPASYSDHIITSKNSFEKFHGETRFSEIDAEYIENYTNWMELRSTSYATAQSYIRDLRTVYNYAVSQKVIRNSSNPFGKGVQIGSTLGRKKAITKDQILKVFECELPTGSNLDLTRDMFVFQYLVNGINVLDLCKFKQRNIDEGGKHLTFIRTKSIRTKKNREPIRAFLQPAALKIIEKWGNKLRGPDDFIFPFFNELKGKDSNPRRERDLSQQVMKNFNVSLEKISNKLKLPMKITTGVARSSFATILKNSGVNMVQIKEAMGHSSIHITEIYLKSSEDEQVKEISLKLL